MIQKLLSLQPPFLSYFIFLFITIFIFLLIFFSFSYSSSYSSSSSSSLSSLSSIVSSYLSILSSNFSISIIYNLFLQIKLNLSLTILFSKKLEEIGGKSNFGFNVFLRIDSVRLEAFQEILRKRGLKGHFFTGARMREREGIGMKHQAGNFNAFV